MDLAPIESVTPPSGTADLILLCIWTLNLTLEFSFGLEVISPFRSFYEPSNSSLPINLVSFNNALPSPPPFKTYRFLFN